VMDEQRGLETLLSNVAEQLLSNRISVAEAERQIADLIKPSVIRMTQLAAGGQKNLQQSPFRSRYYGAAGAHLRRRYGSAAMLAQQISNGELTPNQVRDRIKRFSRVVYPAFDRADLLRRQTEQNHNEAKRDLAPGAKHCPSCPGHVTNGYIPIEEVVPRGHSCVCGGYCKCLVVTRFNPTLGMQNLLGGTLQERVLNTAANQSRLNDGPSLAEVEQLFLQKRGQARARAQGFGSG